jgi:hypothetical protein
MAESNSYENYHFPCLVFSGFLVFEFLKYFKSKINLTLSLTHGKKY